MPIPAVMETNTLHNFLITNSPEYIVMVSDYWLKQEAPLRVVQTLVSILFLIICLTGNCCQVLVMMAYFRYLTLITIEFNSLQCMIIESSQLYNIFHR